MEKILFEVEKRWKQSFDPPDRTNGPERRQSVKDNHKCWVKKSKDPDR